MLVTEDRFASIMDVLSKHKRLTVDTETDGLHAWHGARVCGIAVGIPPADKRKCFYFPFRQAGGGNLSLRRMRQLITLLQGKVLTGWNMKFDLHMLEADGMVTPGYAEDVMLMFHLLDENQAWTGGSYELKVAAARYIDPEAAKAQRTLKDKLIAAGFEDYEMWRLPAKDVETYACDDVFYTESMREILIDPLGEWGLETIWEEVNRYAIISRQFEKRGLLLDVPLMKKYSREAKRNFKTAGDRIIKASRGKVANPGSNVQLQKWLGLRSVAKDVLETMRGERPEMIRTYRQWKKVDSSYYEAYLKRMDADNVLHPNIKLHGTIAGRPSAEDPNLQAVPRKTDIYKVKDIFIARPGYSLISADYSQMELRVGAHETQDQFLIDAFKNNINVHKMTAADLSIEYFEAKQVNFAVQYGTGVEGLADQLGCDLQTASDFLDKAHALHPNYRPYYKQIQQYARENGYIRLWTGRVRRFNTLPNPHQWFHKASSNRIQGAVAEVMRHAITRLGNAPFDDTHMLMQIHDAILFETPTAKLKEALPYINSEMTRDFPFSVPFVVDFKVGQRWGTLKETTV